MSYNPNHGLIPLPTKYIKTNIAEGLERPVYFNLAEFQLSRVEFNTVSYNGAETHLLNCSFAFPSQGKIRTIQAYDIDGRLLPFSDFLSRLQIHIRSLDMANVCKTLSTVFRTVKYGGFLNNLTVSINNSYNHKRALSLISVRVAESLGWRSEAGCLAQLILFYGNGLVSTRCIITDNITTDIVIPGAENINTEVSLRGNLQFISLEPVIQRSNFTTSEIFHCADDHRQ